MRGALGALVFALALACAPGAARAASPACPTGAVLDVVAHEDDSILFQDPDIRADIASGRCLRTVFATAGDAGLDDSYWRRREGGAKASYAQLAGQPDQWTQYDAGIPGRPVPLLVLDGNPKVSLVFLRLPDGQSGGNGFGRRGYLNLQKLWQGTIPALPAVDGSTTYTRDGLVAALASLMSTFGADVVRTQDFVGTFGDGDHSDHHATAYFTKAAGEQFAAPHTLVGYLGYRSSALPANLDAAAAAAKQQTFFAYQPFDPSVCDGVAACVLAGYASWWSRQYLVATVDQGRPPPAPPAPPAATPSDAGTTSVERPRTRVDRRRIARLCHRRQHPRRCAKLAPVARLQADRPI